MVTAGLFILSLGGSILLPALATAGNERTGVPGQIPGVGHRNPGLPCATGKANDHLHPPGTQRSQIIGGKAVAPHSRPFIASIQMDGQHVCGGFLVWPKWVMTAAHCLIPSPSIRVVLGAHRLQEPEESQQIFSVAESIAHPLYTPGAADNDIRLLQLDRPATLNKYVKRIRLPSPHIDLKPGTVCYVLGWGDISNSGDEPTELMETNTTIVKRSLCRTLWRGKVSANMLCGASRNATLQGVCTGDSGGPLVFKDKVYGIVSFSGERCGDRRFPDIYTKISNYIDWVGRQTCAELLLGLS
uniref:Serine protease 57 n=1 Tax=Catharus ustulatus TaxID=91951 RepID=A0A8C3Y1V2_CATUS